MQPACKKSASSGTSSFDFNKTAKTVAINWIEQQKQFSRGNRFIDTLQKSVNWDNASVKNINRHEFLVYAPVKYNNNSTGLVFIVNKGTMLVEQGYVLEISGQPIYKDRSSEIVEKFYTYKSIGFSGTLIAYSIENKFKWELGYKNGDNTYRKGIMNSLNFLTMIKLAAF